MNLYWDVNAPNAPQEIWRGDVDGNNCALIATLAAGVSSYEDTEGDASNSYKVRALGDGDPSAFSEYIPLTIPDAPSGLTFTQIDGDTGTLNWTDNSDDEDLFYVYSGVDGSAIETFITDSVTNSAEIDGPDFTASQFAFKVTAQNGAGESAPSNLAYSAPVTPEIGDLSSGAATIDLFTWNHTAEAGFGWVDHYEIRWRNMLTLGAYTNRSNVAFGTTHDNGWYPAGANDGDTIRVEVRAVSPDGKAGPWATQDVTFNI